MARSGDSLIGCNFAKCGATCARPRFGIDFWRSTLGGVVCLFFWRFTPVSHVTAVTWCVMTCHEFVGE